MIPVLDYVTGRNDSSRHIGVGAHEKSSGATEVALNGVIALVRLLARDASREALADQANRPAAREIAVPAYPEEQSNVPGRRP
jgi:hypothetical protein